MSISEFYNTLQQGLSLPFEVADVTNIESNCGSVYIDLKDGTSYFISIEACEKES